MTYTIPVCPECAKNDNVEADSIQGNWVDWWCSGCEVSWEDDSDNAQAFIAARAEDAE